MRVCNYDGDPFIVYETFGIPNVEFPNMMDLLRNGDPYIVYLACYTTILILRYGVPQSSFNSISVS